MMTNELIVMLDFCQKLTEIGINYMITGGIAVSFIVPTRLTNDVDVVIDMNANKIDDFVRVLSQDYFVDEVALKDAVKKQQMFNIFHKELFVKVDISFLKDSGFDIHEFEKRRA